MNRMSILLTTKTTLVLLRVFLAAGAVYLVDNSPSIARSTLFRCGARIDWFNTSKHIL
jgi:hypothetical protein